MEKFIMRSDIREVCEGEKINIKLTKENISQLLSGKILEGFKTRIGMESDCLNNKGGNK